MKICSAVLMLLHVDKQADRAKPVGAFLQLLVVNMPKNQIDMGEFY
jgi:hypothetical protein